jgi:phosphoribosylglycinamide formyltransferase-1
MKKIVFLASGNGGSIKFLAQSILLYKLPISIEYIISDRECGANDFAKDNKIKKKILNLKRNESLDLLKQILLEVKPDLIITNVHKIIPVQILNLFPNKFLNLHYSLLPSFKGLIGMKTVDKAREIDVKIIGGTAHLIDERLDEGVIVSQGAMIVNWSLENKEIYNQVFQLSCIVFLNAILINLKKDNVNPSKIHFKNQRIYNPALCFNVDKLNNTFWEKIK